MNSERDAFGTGAGSALLKLPAGEIHLWLAFPDQIVDTPLLQAYRELLTDEERQQEGRFFFARDRHRYLITRVLVRTVLSRYCEVPANWWCFRRNHHGRPEIADAPAAMAGLSFNISHTEGLVMLGLVSEGRIGVDVENIATRAALLDVAGRYFSAAEVAALNAMPAALRHERFFEYWTLKESYIKARGMGLSIPLHRFGFHLSAQGIDLHRDADLDDPAPWRLYQLRPSAQHLAALCIDDPARLAWTARVTKVVPLRSEMLMPFAPFRSGYSLAAAPAVRGDGKAWNRVRS